jgi:hypothetical protein
MSEVLAYAATLLEKCLDGRRDLRRLGIKLKIAMDDSHKFEDSI